MSKGTKQFRLGRINRLIDQMEITLKTLEEMEKYTPSHYNGGRIDQLKYNIKTIKSEFNIEA